MNHNYDINDWARDQRNSRDMRAIVNFATLLRLKFPRTNNVITILVMAFCLVAGVSAGIDAGRKPLGVVLYGIISALIGGAISYVFAILILFIILFILVAKFIQPYL